MFRIYCTNKGCSKEMEPILNLENNEVECTECGKNINVPHATKISLRTIGQIKRMKKSEKAFSVECKKCKKMCVPKLNDNKEVICAHCNQVLDLSTPFITLIKEKLKNGLV